MSLNIKNERTHALVRELAILSGVSQTEAVNDAVSRRLDELNAERDQQARFDRIMAIAEETGPILQKAGIVSTDFLYDDYGLPA